MGHTYAMYLVIGDTKSRQTHDSNTHVARLSHV
ncbi:hypothetical protein SCOR_02865 [Sulfidibacter corallicola]